MERYRTRAEELLEQGYTEESLTNMRKFTEAAIKELGLKFDCLVDGKYSVNSTREKLRKHIPPRLYYYIGHIMNMGNYGSHFQEDGVVPSIEDAQYCIYAGDEVFQWMHPEIIEDPIDDSSVFIEEAFEAVSCNTCGSGVGEKCVGISSGISMKNNIHKGRRRAYNKYRRDFQKHYGTTITNAMYEMVNDIGLKKGELLPLEGIRTWFADKYPAYSKSAVEEHSRMMTTNLKARRRHSESKNGDEKYNLFFEEKRKFRLYDSEHDPVPYLFGSS